MNSTTESLRCRGSSLATVLVIFAILTILSSVIFYMERSSDRMQAMAHDERQGRLLSDGLKDGVKNVALSKRKPGDHLDYKECLDRSTFCSILSWNRVGIWGEGHINTFNTSTAFHYADSSTWLVLAKASDGPTVVLLDSIISVGLGGMASIEKSILFQGSSIEKSPRIEVRSTNPAPLPMMTTTLDFKKSGIEMPDTASLRSWMRGVLDGSIPLPRVLESDRDEIVWSKDCINGSLVASRVTLTKDAELNKCTIVAKKIVVQDGAQIKFSQLLARDTLILGDLSKSKLLGWALVTGSPDSANIPKMELKSTKGSGFFGLFRLYKKVVPHVSVDSSSHLTGVIWTNGNVDFRGTLKGQMVAGDFIAIDRGTIWLGLLLDGQISAAANPKRDLPFLPLLWPKDSSWIWLRTSLDLAKDSTP